MQQAECFSVKTLTNDEMFQQSDSQPGQHHAGKFEDGPAHEEHVDGHVQTAQAKVGEGEVGRVRLNVVNQLEDREPRKEGIKICQPYFFELWVEKNI